MESAPWAGGEPVRAASPADPAMGLSLRWLRLACRREIQQYRWSRLEHILIEERGWLQLTEAERQDSPHWGEFRRIERRLDRLFADGEAATRELEAARSTSLRGVYAKLTVIERMMWPDNDGAMHVLLTAAIEEFAALCPEVRDQPVYRLWGRYRAADRGPAP